MNMHHLFVNDSCNGQRVKGTVGGLPHLQTQSLSKLLYTFTRRTGRRERENKLSIQYDYTQVHVLMRDEKEGRSKQG